jgi:hypothetical protein
MSAADASPPVATGGVEFFRNFTRIEAERVLYYYPTKPILRPCSYTETHPTIFAVSYVPPARQIHHVLVEKLPDGRYRAMIDETDAEGTLRIRPTGQEWLTEADMHVFFRSQSTRFPSPLMYSFGSSSARSSAVMRAPLLRASSGAHTTTERDASSSTVYERSSEPLDEDPSTAGPL